MKPSASYRGWLAVVIILGVLLVAGVVGLIVAAVLRARSIRAAPTDQPYTASVIAPGEKIESAELDGNRILLTLQGPRGEELVVLDAGSGKILGRITVRP